MNKEGVRYFTETQLLDSLLLETTGSFRMKKKIKPVTHKHCDFCRASNLPSHHKLMKKHIYRKKNYY